MGVNLPSVQALRHDHYRGICVACNLTGKSKKGSMGRGHATGDHGRRTSGTPKKYRES